MVVFIFQLLTAVMQKIVYDEFLESFLSDETMSSYGLRSSASYTYNKTLNPSITNDFGMAYRYRYLAQCLRMRSLSLSSHNIAHTYKLQLELKAQWLIGSVVDLGLKGC